METHVRHRGLSRHHQGKSEGKGTRVKWLVQQFNMLLGTHQQGHVSAAIYTFFEACFV